ncbi:MAG: hypothetical protein JWO33_983 [Caulobacteraceae bacterium]|nr:hypothetical protein [Caulobacteraceae bacterium]
MTVDDIRSRVVVVRVWAIDHEELEKAHKEEAKIWEDVLQAIADGAGQPAELAKAALETRYVKYPRGFA